MAEDDMLAVQPLGLDGADKELGSVGIRSSIGHGKDTGSSVLQLDIFKSHKMLKSAKITLSELQLTTSAKR